MAADPVKSLKLTSSEIRTGTDLPLPGMLRATTRSGADEIDPLLAGLVVDKVYALAATTRGAVNEHAGEIATLESAQPELLAVETDDGATLFIRSDALAEAVALLQPEAVSDGEVDFARFDDPRARSRGIAQVLWKTATVLRLPADAVLDEAKALALEWAKEKFGEAVEAKVYDWGSVLGAKALMWKIESRLAGQPGLYRWNDKRLSGSDYCPPGDPRLADAAQGKAMLVLIHGTGSYTVGSYADLRDDEPTWLALRQRFPGGIFGFEHRTFSESPAENALALLEALPKGAKVSLLTHSRGGLVGDLLALGQVADRTIDAYRIDTRDADDAAGLERVAEEERARLRRIRDLLLAGRISVQRYVRVASPARGTRFLSDNLDAALSDFLGALQWGGGALVGVAASALGGPVAGEAFGKGASSCLGVVKRLALEIAGRRIDPRLLPGIAAMRTDSPLAAFLADADTHRRDSIEMAVIAGDTEFDGFGLSTLRRRIASVFCDWRLFDGHNNDLVVDTDSMYAGLGVAAGARYLYDQDASVTHFRYFCNATTRDALRAWLAEDEVSRATQFLPLSGTARTSWRDRQALQTQRGQRGAAPGPRPVVILLADFMATHLKLSGKPKTAGAGRRVWLDMASLAAGRLSGIADRDNVVADDLFEIFYGDLADHLAATHTVIRCPCDWRQSPDQCAVDLKTAIESAAHDCPGQPISLLAHGVGGLVARALMAIYPPAWQSVVDSGGRLLMLGTPNRGTHHIVHTLLGKTDALRLPARLARPDGEPGLQGLVELFGAFPGALALLPRPDFADSGSEPRIASSDYYAAQTWRQLKAINVDRWHGDGIGAEADEKLLGRAAAFWRDTLAHNEIANPDRVAYVFGQSDKTPCGVQRSADGRIKLLFTSEGDGMATWASGRLDNLDTDTRCWLMPVEHADLSCAAEYFPAIVELLEKGSSDKLGRLPRQRGEAAASFVLDCAPPVLAGADELARAALGSALRRRPAPPAKSTLKVSARAGDLRFLDQPVLCGHYIGDAISGAEAALDEMLAGALSERDRLGVYAAEIGTCAIIVRPPSSEEGARGSRLGAVVVGLGKFTGQLSARHVSETVRSGVLRFLLQLRDALKVRQNDEVQLYSLLIGWNSTASISVAESVAAITRGVLEANHQFSDALSKSRQNGATVSHLCFIELYRNAAISAAHAVLDLPENLASELKRMGTRIDPAPTLIVGEGMMDRLNVEGDLGHWARLIVTDADAAEADALPNPHGRPAAVPAVGADAPGAAARYYPERLKYVFLSQRARAETVVQQRQPGLIEAIIRDQRRNPAYDARLGHTLFQLMVPLDYKAVAREQSRLLMVLDGYTANLPWELLQNEGEPLVLKMPMIRQLTTLHYRPTVRTANVNSACLIVAPSTEGFERCFGGGERRLPELPAAVREGQAISDSLRRAGWHEGNIVVSPPGKEALDVFATLFERPYRILVISAHGIFEALGLDGRCYSGVVLSDGLLLTAVEIDLMDVVPEVVFLSCCHLASVNNPHNQPNKLAYSLSRTLIEMGVRCVVAAGWAVNDEAACTFASTFFDELTAGENFGDAIFRARKAAYQQHPGSNTWGAYQAYGDPGYRLQTSSSANDGKKSKRYVAVDELLAAITGQRIKNKRQQNNVQSRDFAAQQQWLERQVARCPGEWAARPEVLQGIAEFYADYAGDAFEAARAAYQRAVQLEDRSGRVAVRAIEQLANMEARQGRKLAQENDIDGGLTLIGSAIRRLAALAESVRGDLPSEIRAANPERAATLGSAYKLKAAILMQKGAAWAAVTPVLQQAARAYAGRAAEGASPYNTLNALALDWLTGSLAQSPAEAAALARQCGALALQRFAASKDFWDAITGVDAEIVAWLLGSPAAESAAAAGAGSVAAVFQRHYEEALQSLPGTAREWDSVVKQWRLLAGFIDLSARRKAAPFAAALRALADHFDPQPAAPSRPAPAATAPRKRRTSVAKASKVQARRKR